MQTRRNLIIASALCLANILAADTQVNVTTTDLQLFPSIAKTDSGFITAYVTNHMSGKHCEIYAQRLDDNISVQWGSDFYISNHDNENGHRLAVKVIPGDSGSAIAAWINHRDAKLYAQRINPDRTKEWGSYPYRPLYVHPANPNYVYTPPEMCSDDAGGAIFDKILIRDIIVNAVLKGYNKHQLNPFVGSRRTT